MVERKLQSAGFILTEIAVLEICSWVVPTSTHPEASSLKAERFIKPSGFDLIVFRAMLKGSPELSRALFRCWVMSRAIKDKKYILSSEGITQQPRLQFWRLLLDPVDGSDRTTAAAP